MSIFEPGEKVTFVEEGFPLTGKRGIVDFVRNQSVTVTFEGGLGTSTWRESFFLPAPDSPSSAPPSCGAV